MISFDLSKEGAKSVKKQAKAFQDIFFSMADLMKYLSFTISTPSLGGFILLLECFANLKLKYKDWLIGDID